jgi:carboxylesterase type B
VTEVLARTDPDSASLVEPYRELYPDADPIPTMIAVSSGRARKNAIEQAERKIAGGTSPVYMYVFAHEGHPVGDRKYAAHALELDFLFGNFTRTERTPANHLLCAQLGGAWSNFARDTRPDSPDLPAPWPAYDLTDRTTMIFDTPESRVENDPFGGERLLWNAVGG